MASGGIDRAEYTVVNSRTAKALGLNIPHSMQLLADEGWSSGTFTHQTHEPPRQVVCSLSKAVSSQACRKARV
jgi:hypothetical protein